MPGEAKNSWLTGSAAWNYVAITQWILGIRPEHGGLRIDPCLPAAWAGFEATRRFRGSTYRIAIANPSASPVGSRRCSSTAGRSTGTSSLPLPRVPMWRSRAPSPDPRLTAHGSLPRRTPTPRRP